VTTGSSVGAERPRRWLLAAPALAAAILALPCLGWGYFWDDYFFLTRAQRGLAAALEYVKGAAFYRPLTQGLYFMPFAHGGDSGALAAHALNLAVLAASAWLLAVVVARRAGTRAGLLAGLFFSGVAPAPSLVGWASGAQDLLAILFFLAALALHDSGRTAWAALAMAAALLSKEAIGVAMPVLILWDAIVGRKPARVLGPLAAFGGLALLWGALHPGIRLLVTGRLENDPRSYVGFQNATMVALEARRYMLALVNAPVTGARTPWPADLAPYGAAAWVVGVIALFLARRRPGETATVESAPASGALTIPRALLLGALIAIPALLLPSLVIRRWAAYFVCIPALGLSIALGVALARVPVAMASAALAVFLALGVWSRGVEDPSGALLTERSFITGERATRDIEQRFRRLYPTLPRGSHVLVSVAASGMAGIHGTLHDGQAIRVWYNDPAIRVLDPEERPGDAPHEILLRITERRDLVAIDPDTPSFRSTGAAPDVAEVRMVIGTYARGVAAAGEPVRALRILDRLARTEPEALARSYDLRLAAMILLAQHDEPGAERVLAAAPPWPRDVALDATARVLAQPTRWAALDSCAYRAFGTSPRDPDALRYWMAMFYGSGYLKQARATALRLQEIAPGDPESGAVLKKLARLGT
jgi:hypothetical protein